MFLSCLRLSHNPHYWFCFWLHMKYNNIDYVIFISSAAANDVYYFIMLHLCNYSLSAWGIWCRDFREIIVLW